MQRIKDFRRKFPPLRSHRQSFITLVMLALLTVLGISWTGQQPLQAQYLPTAIRSNPWQYASFPVENFQTYTSLFGYRKSPTGGKPQFHSGIDMAAPLGSYVRNWWQGRVVELSDNTACGTSIKIQSGEWQHLYCHLMGQVEVAGGTRYLLDSEGGILLQQGQEIPVGARIGRVGMTGRTTGPHLHWALIYGGSYVDPALVLQVMFQRPATS